MTLIQRTVPSSRVLIVKPRGSSDTDGDVIGSIRMKPGDVLDWALEFKGTNLPPGLNLYGMSEPETGGADSAKLVVAGHTEDDTQAKFTLALSDTATTSSEITLSVEVQLSEDESMIVNVPFEVIE